MAKASTLIHVNAASTVQFIASLPLPVLNKPLSMKNQLSYLEKIYNLTQAMLKHSESEDWQAIAEAEAERRKLYPKINHLALDNNEQAAALLKEILRLNLQITACIEQHKENSQQALLSHHRSEKAKNKLSGYNT